MIENNLKSKNKLQKHRVSYHWFFCLLYSLSVTAALYRHGHPVFSITVIFLCFPATLSKYLPQKILSKDNREMLLYIFIVAGLAWGMIRAEAGFVSPDIMLIESVALLGIGFFFNCKHHDYALMMLISGILLSYATLFPNVIVLNLFPPIFILTLFILYSSRLMSFAPLKPEESQKIFARINWKFFLIHFLLSSIVTVYFFSLFPIYPQDTKGFIPVHFKTHSDDITPEKFRRWSETSKKTPGLRGEKKENMPILGIGKSKEIISRGDSEGETVLGLSGAGRTGKELLFRVQSPVTLYWLTNLYDSYNGKIWTKSDKLKNKKKFRKLSYKKKVVQTFLIEKWSGRSLPAAFYNFFTTQVSLTPKYHIKREKLNYLLAKDKEYPQTPFKYSASSVLNVYNGKDFRILKIPLKHYIRLPENKISDRILKLAEKITANTEYDYQKAMKLRNWLRENFEYSMKTKPIPEGKEPIDFFLFEQKRGHCEYFAASLAIMARSIGLPTRVAVGFSPGNFNLINRIYEVYEYHAHAWTQIYIKSKGWLTFDATPPAELNTKNFPTALNIMKEKKMMNGKLPRRK